MDASALEKVRQCYEANGKELFVYALSLTGTPETAEDAVHAAFTGVLRMARLPRDLRPYVFRCVRNAAIDHARTAAKPRLEPVMFERNGHADPNLPILIEDALAALTLDERETIVLKTYSGLTFREIADTREVSINTAASWYRRGIEKLRAALEDSTT
ncbi:MAG: sigma-70 family RNA polymerase sigma factor [Candidatus Hydrogenedentota bacterium]